MTPQKAKELLPIIQAFAEGKTIQFKLPGVSPWFDQDKEKPNLEFGDFYEYRIKPEPKLRPWKPEEVPLGALMRLKGCSRQRWLITYAGPEGYAAGTGGFKDTNQLDDFLNHEHSTDGGKTWKPCGVEE